MSAMVEAVSRLVGVLKIGTPEHQRAYAEVCRQFALERLDAIPPDVDRDYVTGAEWVGRITATLAEVLDALADEAERQ
jgi:hypothetical protein